MVSTVHYMQGHWLVFSSAEVSTGPMLAAGRSLSKRKHVSLTLKLIGCALRIFLDHLSETLLQVVQALCVTCRSPLYLALQQPLCLPQAAKLRRLARVQEAAQLIVVAVWGEQAAQEA